MALRRMPTAEEVEQALEKHKKHLEWEIETLQRAGHEAKQQKAELAQLNGDAGQTNGQRKLSVRRASEIRMQATQWLWEEDGQFWLPLGEMTLLGGREGVGKSTMAYDIAAKLTQGTLPGAYKGEPRSVIVCATEDSWSKTIVPRLMAAGADLTRVLQVNAVTPDGLPMNVKLPSDIPGLEELVGSENAVLIILDPLMSAVDGKLDPHKDQSVRQALEPMTALAHKANAAIVGLIHQKKGAADDLRQKLTGSGAFVAVSRSVLYCGMWKPPNSEEDAPRVHLFGQIKCNLGPLADLSYRYSIRGVANLGTDSVTKAIIGSSRIAFDGIENGNIEDLLIEAEKDAQRKKRDLPIVGATVWLLNFMRNRSIPKQEVLEAAKRAEYAKSTVERAFKELGGKSSPIPGTSNKAYWRLPQQAGTPTTDTEETEEREITDVTEETEETPSDERNDRDKGVVDEILESPQSPQLLSARDLRRLPLGEEALGNSPPCGKCGSALTGKPAKPGCEEIHVRWSEAS